MADNPKPCAASEPEVPPTAPPNELLIAATLTAGFWAGSTEMTMKDYLQTFDRFIREVRTRREPSCTRE
jgi:hypothetical protein